jgi:hypothetical protein
MTKIMVSSNADKYNIQVSSLSVYKTVTFAIELSPKTPEP